MRVTRSVTIPDSEIELRYSRSGGPGGQHANKTSTKAELTWNVSMSSALGPIQRARLMTNLRRRLDSSGTLRLTSDRHRSQTRNKEEVLLRLEELVRGALQVQRARVATAPTRRAQEQRLAQKRRRSETKKRRRKPFDDD